MPLSSTIQASFDRSFELYRDLIDSLQEETLSSRLPNLPSNKLGLQLWCVVGARESFARAIEANEWSGFACSLESPAEKTSVQESLNQSADQVQKVLAKIESYSDTQNQLIINLLEHEVAHH